MNRFKKGDRVIAQAIMKEHPLCFCGEFRGTVVDDLPEIKNIEYAIPYRVHIDGDPEGKSYSFLAYEMKKINDEEELEVIEKSDVKDDYFAAFHKNSLEVLGE